MADKIESLTLNVLNGSINTLESAYIDTFNLNARHVYIENLNNDNVTTKTITCKSLNGLTDQHFGFLQNITCDVQLTLDSMINMIYDTRLSTDNLTCYNGKFVTLTTGTQNIQDTLVSEKTLTNYLSVGTNIDTLGLNVSDCNVSNISASNASINKLYVSSITLNDLVLDENYIGKANVSTAMVTCTNLSCKGEFVTTKLRVIGDALICPVLNISTITSNNAALDTLSVNSICNMNYAKINTLEVVNQTMLPVLYPQPFIYRHAGFTSRVVVPSDVMLTGNVCTDIISTNLVPGVWFCQVMAYFYSQYDVVSNVPYISGGLIDSPSSLSDYNCEKKSYQGVTFGPSQKWSFSTFKVFCVVSQPQTIYFTCKSPVNIHCAKESFIACTRIG
jgi:hypothetical protein